MRMDWTWNLSLVISKGFRKVSGPTSRGSLGLRPTGRRERVRESEREREGKKRHSPVTCTSPWGSIRPEAGFTEYLEGAVVFTLKQTRE